MIEDIHTFPDLYAWLRLGFVPLALNPNYVYSEGYPYQDIAETSIKIGGDDGHSWLFSTAEQINVRRIPLQREESVRSERERFDNDKSAA